MKEVNTRNFPTFELGTQEGKNVPLWIFAGFQQKGREDSQKSNNGSFHRPPVTSAQCNIATENIPDAAKLPKDFDEDYSQGYGLVREAFRSPTKKNIFNPYTSDHDFRPTNVNDAGENDDSASYNLYKFDKRYQKTIETAQPIKVEFKFCEDVAAGVYGYALVLTNKLESRSSDAQRHLNVI